MIQNVNELPNLDELISNGYITKRKHPAAKLFIYNYTARAQYSDDWNEATLTCRGLITDGEGNIVSRPFKKFFNLDQVQTLPDEPFQVFDKLDGSLGISYWYNGKACIASRGSFTGDQAMQGTEMLIAWEEQSGQKLNPQWTYLFEIIYPENQIVCDYGSTRELVLIAVIDTATGQELPLYNNRGWPNFDMPMVGQLEWIKTIDQLKQFVEQLEWVETAEELKRFVPDNDGGKRGSVIEGFVLRYQSGLRVKVKTTEYTRLHRILTGITEKNLLEDYLMTGADLQPLLERVPDEFYGWVKATVADFQGQYDTIERDAKAMLAEYAGQDRRTCGIAFSKMAFAHVLFKMLDGKPYEKMIWKLIRPKTLTTFKLGAG